jgi:hypothetical protein
LKEYQFVKVKETWKQQMQKFLEFCPAPSFLVLQRNIDNGIKLLVAIPENVPVIDSLKF